MAIAEPTLLLCQHEEQGLLVIPAQAGFECRNLNSACAGMTDPDI
jgi:hypothetical protein